jgi:hypothetical protein
MRDFEAAAAASIHATFAAELPVRYTGAGLINQPVQAVKSDTSAEPFQGAGNTLRQISFEIQQAALPGEPGKGNGIVEDDGAGQAWLVNDVTRRDDIGAWILVVEEADA